MQQTYDLIVSTRIVAGLRGHFTPEVAIKTVSTLLDYGVQVFEFTMNSTQPITAMQAVKREFGEAVCVGMGTVLDVEAARRVLDAGAQFVVSPAFQPDVVETVMKANVLIAPGVITPTEAVLAWEMGVKMLKLFPIGSLGVDYFKAVFAPLNHMKFMCNGGMNAENAAQFIQAGAVACGMAGWLTGDGYMDQALMRRRAEQLVQAVFGKDRVI
ncbi:MAG: 2-dehydro-3-deoxyphosphogluconate aldolase [Phototrophicales bacterium]|nr:MAG: 2-dehydro-3-deoxyphosphogluconate aldolase [Phototrophicales bacterium]RMG70288.1 MAG: 2-dehydro-3-deoxyphosphogluconate aldolase [Chloroflexota bacterium]